MLSVSNTSPISNLASIGRLDLLFYQFPELWIPPAVAEELAAHPEPASIKNAIDLGQIQIAPPPPLALVKILSLQLHLGEAEAIALASERQAGILLIDEQEGRRVATEIGLKVTGVLGALLRAKELGQINAIRPEILALRAKARFFISPKLEARVLAAAHE